MHLLESFCHRCATALAVGALFLMVGCTEGDVLTWQPESPAEKSLRASREALQRTVGEGSAAGAAGGALIGAALGGVQGAFRGAQVGQLGGATAGNYVKQIQASYAAREDELEAIAADLRATIAKMDASISAMKAAKAERAARAERDPVRDARVAEEVVATVDVAEGYGAFFGEARGLVLQDGSAGPVDPELARLQASISSMRSIAAELADI